MRKVLSISSADAIQADLASRAFDDFAARLRARNTVVGDARSRARAILEFAHAEILRGEYDVRGSDLAATLAGGPFNCATATAVFLALAGQFDVAAQAVSVVGHVWCRVSDGEQSFDVETTCPQWFSLAERADRARDQSPLWRQHIDRVAAARMLDEPAFLAIFHFNRGVRLLRERKFAPAAAANLAAIELDPRCQAAYDNLRASVSQLSLVPMGREANSRLRARDNGGADGAGRESTFFRRHFADKSGI